MFVFVAIVAFLVREGSGQSSSINGTVYYNSKGHYFTLKSGVLDKENGVAYGTFEDSIMKNGWGELNIVSGTGSKQYDDKTIMFAAGYLEGALTAKRINDHYQNVFGIFFKSNQSALYNKVINFFQKQDDWMRTMISRNSGNSSLWRQMGNILAQYDGLVSGYQAHPPKDKVLPHWAFQILNGVGDLLDLKHALQPEQVPDWNHMTEQEITRKIFMKGHCSALIKVLPGFENIFASHASWFAYAAMVRIYKHYYFDLKDSTTGATKTSFSSYPGFLESLDDFYIMNSGLILLQTTNNVFNTSLYQYVQPQSLLAWQRVRLANLMAKTGDEWAAVFEQYNSGTYNNQYMILDLKRVELNKTLHDGALWVVEQIPTYVASGDQTALLRLGYWPSYNVPFYEKVYNMSGYPQFVEKHGESFSYQLAPRAKIFRRDQATVHDMDTMKYIMRYNDYKHDPYAFNNPDNAICARGDLDSTNPSADGCYDAKVTDYFMAQSLVSSSISGPTAQGLPPFHWSQYKFPDSHVGMADLFNFDFVTMKPKL
ncbi:phospholipase B-like 1 [Exaiptasia diaphana]|uniref:Phospholipase B-like n=1 Tax=Exaiptasia diaphana TaxID=2652724 RepID=A0A913XGM6_EXADI|nr:phospholipase B-like 1 [Exaiptasia diaphana]KXJ12225.1 Phospholipase B-like 1 [Exaiptasia diaphana]